MDLKILIACHKPSYIINNKYFTYVYGGMDIINETSKDGNINENDITWIKNNFIGDNIGENISNKNRFLNELTIIYWAWKNYKYLKEPDYIGFMHYRRHFLFLQDSLKSKSKIGYSYRYDYINKDYENNINPKFIDNIGKYDLIIPKFFDCAKETNNFSNTIMEHYLTYMDTNRSLIKIEKYILNSAHLNKYKKEAINFYNFKGYYPLNMFIMKKDLFFEYAEFIFDIFNYLWSDDLEKELIFKGINYQRELAWALEIATSIFIKTKINQGLLYKEYEVSFVENTDCSLEYVSPIFKSQLVGIVFILNKDNIHYISVSICSLINNCNIHNKYDICILLEEEISDDDRKKILDLRTLDNISIRFFKIKNFSIIRNSNVGDIKKVYMMLLPSIFIKYKYIITLNSISLICSDILNLINESCKAVNFGRNMEITLKSFAPKADFYNIKYDLNIFDLNVIVFDIQRCHEINFVNIFIHNFVKEYCCKIDFGDNIYNKIFFIMNEYFSNDIHLFSLKCSLSDFILSSNFYPTLLTSKLYQEYNDFVNSSSCIIRFNSIYELNNYSYNASLWWHYARKTLFYEEILIISREVSSSACVSSACVRIKSHLSYKIGQCLIKLKRFNPMDIILFPFRILSIYITYKKDMYIKKYLIENNVIKEQPIEFLHDYQLSLKIKKQLTYRLGHAFKSNPFLFVFKVYSIYKQYKLDKKGEK